MTSLSETAILGIVVGVSLGVVAVVPLAHFVFGLFGMVVVVERGTVAIVERLGRFNRLLGSGVHFLIPFIDDLRPFTRRTQEKYVDAKGHDVVRIGEIVSTRIDVRESMLEVASMKLVSRDHAELKVNPTLLFRISDPMRAAYECKDLDLHLERLVQTSMRSVIGGISLDDTLASRQEICTQCLHRMQPAAFDLGVTITRVDLLDVNPTELVQNAMHRQLASERVRRALVATASGYKEQTKTEAEGKMQGLIATSKGDQSVAVLRARGRADSKRKVCNHMTFAKQCIHNQTMRRLLLPRLRRSESLGKLSKNTKLMRRSTSSH
jgi:regulator of protease activity HflC (stomatin/prohibitin superfamily)